MWAFPCTKNTPITVCVYLCSACSVVRVCMTRKQAAYAYHTNLSCSGSWCKCIFRGSQGHTRECFGVVKVGGILVQDTWTGHCGQRCDRKTSSRERGIRRHANSDTETSHACIQYLKRWWNQFYFDERHLEINRSKLKGQYTYSILKLHGSVPTVGLSLNLHSLS